ncbi:MAG: hypothetical protein AAFW00_00850 [Bacteroidota bacterium]
MKNLQILIREKNPIIASILQIQIQDVGYTAVDGPTSLSDFIKAREQIQPELSIIGIDLADLPDRQSISILFEELALHPTLFLIAYPRMTSELSRYISSPHDILYKPFSHQDFLQKLQNIPIIRTYMKRTNA